jgi:hypothetical protein
MINLKPVLIATTHDRRFALSLTNEEYDLIKEDSLDIRYKGVNKKQKTRHQPDDYQSEQLQDDIDFLRYPPNAKNT